MLDNNFMVTKTTKAVAKVADEDALAALAEGYKQEENTQGIRLPRFSLVSQDITEEVGTGKNKKINILTPAGTFVIERETEEEEDILDEKGKIIGFKKVWSREEIGEEAELIIFYKRFQLAEYDNNTKVYSQSPVYDEDTEELPLFSGGTEIERGTPKELRAKYMFEDRNGKQKCSLEIRRVLYVLYKDEVFQWTLRGSSMWSLSTYEKNVISPTVITHVTSVEEENGDIKWNKAKFTKLRTLNADEATRVLALKDEMNTAIARIKAGFSEASDEDDEDEDEAEKPKKLDKGF